jgi:hypothetical protein
MPVRILPNVQALQDCAARPERSEVEQPGDMQASEATLASTQRPRTGIQSEIFTEPQ